MKVYTVIYTNENEIIFDGKIFKQRYDSNSNLTVITDRIKGDYCEIINNNTKVTLNIVISQNTDMPIITFVNNGNGIKCKLSLIDKYDCSNISKWNVSGITDMRDMFIRCKDFNCPLNNWDVSNVTDMSNMFKECYRFNQPLNDWKISVNANVGFMFSYSRANSRLSHWFDRVYRQSLSYYNEKYLVEDLMLDLWQELGDCNGLPGCPDHLDDSYNTYDSNDSLGLDGPMGSSDSNTSTNHRNNS